METQESFAIISQFQAYLNRSDVVADRGFRRDSGVYQLVCYVNNITGLFLSENFEIIPIFVARSVEHMESFPAHTSKNEQYYSLVASYLKHMTWHLKNNVEGVEFDESRIPNEILEGGFQMAPNLMLDTDGIRRQST